MRRRRHETYLRLRLPLIGRVDRDVSGAWQVFGPDGQPSSAVRGFLSDLSASDCAVSTNRSYAYDLLRWFRLLLICLIGPMLVRWPLQMGSRWAGWTIRGPIRSFGRGFLTMRRAPSI